MYLIEKWRKHRLVNVKVGLYFVWVLFYPHAGFACLKTASTSGSPNLYKLYVAQADGCGNLVVNAGVHDIKVYVAF